MHDYVICANLLWVVTGKVKVEIVGRILPRLIGPLRKLAAPTLDNASTDWFSNPANLHK
jgi:hypothetical protein